MIYYLTKKNFQSNEFIVKTDNIKEIIHTLKQHKVLAIDTETNGLSFLKHQIMMLQIGTLDKDQYVIDCRDYDIQLFKDILEDNNILKIGHNLKFDYNMFKRYRIILDNIFDTMVADMLIYNGAYAFDEIIKNKRYSLYGVYFHYFKKKIEKSTRNEFEFWGELPFTENQIIYGSNDVIYTIDIYKKQLEKIEEYDLQTVIDLEMEVTLCLGDMEYNGMKIDIDKWKENVKTYSTKVKELEIELDKHLLNQQNTLKYKKAGHQLDLFDIEFEDKRLTDVNWSSSQQVLKILTKIYKIFPKDKYGKLSSGAEALMLLPSSTEITDLIKRYRDHKKIISSFGENIINQLKNDNRLHTTYNQIVETGRISSRKPNLQQIPNTQEFRQAFISEEGYKLSFADYSSQESIVMADQANDEAYIDFFNNGDGDPHSFVATKVFSVAFNKKFIVTKYNKNKEYRQKGKTLNFAISFQSSAKSIADRLRITKEEAQELIDFFFKGFPGLKKYFESKKRFGIKYGYIRTNNLTKRIRWLREWKDYKQLELKSRKYLTKEERSKLGKLKGRIERKACNTPIQGSSADITKYALVFIRRELLKKGIKPLFDAEVKLIACIHDESALEIKEGKEYIYSHLQEECMEKAGALIVNKINLKAKAEIGNYWKH